ncbi:integral membrane protein [Moelleriella libera RCEF 2490]|uniref:Integral membrane protein n=1 Tax=Moelleriella libera RCEF 2490 TaxID=1081109 RepID=A0A167XU95_9HYPO|nr:integral membrane protein [Moelleriella libera RCEF 2490]
MSGLSYTIVPFQDPAQIPACAVNCQPLWDANGGCVPPAIPSAEPTVYQACFCANKNVAAFSTAVSGVCDNACPGDPQGVSSIARWFSQACNVQAGATNTPKTATSTSAKAANTAGSSGSNNGGNNGGGDWLSGHWQWVIMLVILVVGIAGIWIGACIWRRRYLRKKDRQTSLGQKHSGSAANPSWGPAVTGSDSATPITFPLGRDAERGVVNEKPRKEKQKKTWTVTERT